MAVGSSVQLICVEHTPRSALNEFPRCGKVGRIVSRRGCIWWTQYVCSRVRVGGTTVGTDETVPDRTEVGSKFESYLGQKGELLGCNQAVPYLVIATTSNPSTNLQFQST